ncbi:DUF6941 family protein [Cytobacillus firmus]|uniref:DUF6941 family protein n=1 Tax=Cytobacillus firmus TaxID=1399 RepID=UPI0018CCD54C|nr:hypothetical protein [Cytobacillus firmus]MBG9655397.1 hypothetical protein [Cytobacillus firmus]MED1908543.1 hypothetical protein [Cytobacillus firmus]
MSNIFPKYILTCKDVIHHEDDSVSYKNVFENIEVNDLPGEINFYLVLGIEHRITKKGNRKISVKLTDPEGVNVASKDLVFELSPAAKNQIRFSLNIIDVSQFVVDAEGTYSILVHHNGELLTRHDFLVERGIKNDSLIDDHSTVPI